MENDDLPTAFRRYLGIGWVLFVDLVIYIVVVEVIRRFFFPFRGFWQTPAVLPFRTIFFTLALGNYFLLKWLPLLPLKSPRASNEPVKYLGFTALITYALCEGVALLGLISFLLFGLYRDFFVYIFLTLIYLAMFHPRYRDWEEWIAGR